MYRKLKEEATHTKELPISTVLEILKRNFHNLPLPLHHCIIREMEGYALLAKVNAYRIKILYTDKDRVLNNINNLLF